MAVSILDQQCLSAISVHITTASLTTCSWSCKTCMTCYISNNSSNCPYIKYILMVGTPFVCRGSMLTRLSKALAH